MIKRELLKNSVRQINITKISENKILEFRDIVAVEEPLEIQINYGAKNNKKKKNISVTMRTPGNDEELALGFLFTEGIISGKEQIKSITNLDQNNTLNPENKIVVELVDDFIPLLIKSNRNFYAISSCGICGKDSIEAVRIVSPFKGIEKKIMKISIPVLCLLPQQLKKDQFNFSLTGGIHASAIFDTKGNFLTLREDVGRHNALDKLIGYLLSTNSLPSNDKILLLSGRTSFELIQKAIMAGITFIASIGAPSNLAVDLAREFDITLIGFLKENKFNIYSQSDKHFLE